MSLARDLLIGIAATGLLAALAVRTLPPVAPAVVVPPAVALPAPAARPAVQAARPPRAVTPPQPSVPVPVPVRTRNGHALDLQGQDVAAFIARRTAAARTGDARAAYEIYQAASLCAAAEPALADFEMPAERQDAEAERHRIRALCAHVSAAQVQERTAFLARAAQAGSRDARIDFFMEGPQGRAVEVEVEGEPDDPLVAEWRHQALGFLQQAGAQCDPFALALLANAYDLGKLVPRDPRMTMAYAMAAAAARREALTEGGLRARFGEELAPAAFEAARQQGAALARQVCPH
jgi:hypothetical protein